MNDKLLERKHFIMRGIESKNVANIAEAKREIAEIEDKIAANTKQFLADNNKKLIEESLHVKTTVVTDGNMKRAIATVIINLLEEHLNPADLKGVFRQGYKIMRSKC